MEHAHPFRSIHISLHSLEFFYLFVSIASVCFVSFFSSSSLLLSQLKLVLWQENFYISLLRGIFKIAYLFREQKFFIRLYKDRAFLLSASMVFLWFRLFAIFHAIFESVSQYSSLLLISHSNKRCKSLHFLAASYSTDCICLVVDAFETKQ